MEALRGAAELEADAVVPRRAGLTEARRPAAELPSEDRRATVAGAFAAAGEPEGEGEAVLLLRSSLTLFSLAVSCCWSFSASRSAAMSSGAISSLRLENMARQTEA